MISSLDHLGSLAQPSCKLVPFPFCFFLIRACQAELLFETDGCLDHVSRNKECAVKTCENNGILSQPLGLHRFNFARFRTSFSFHGFLNTPSQSQDLPELRLHAASTQEVHIHECSYTHFRI